MTRIAVFTALAATTAIVTSCTFAPQPPIATAIPHTTQKFGDTRTDSYYWLQNPDSQNVVDYIMAENSYTEAMMEPTLTAQRTLYNEMNSRKNEIDETMPIFQNGYYYYIRYEKGKELPINCRRKGKMDSPEEIILDENDVAAGHEFCTIASLDISPNNKILAYAIDTCGQRKFTIIFKNLDSGLLLSTKIENTSGSVAWANDNTTVFYAQLDNTAQPHSIFRHSLGSRCSKDDIEIFHELDPAFNVNVFTSKSREYILILSKSSTSTEYQYLDAYTPNGKFTIFQPRMGNHEYHIFPANNKFYIKTNWNAENYRIMETTANKTGIKFWAELIPHDSSTTLMDVDIFRDFMVVMARKNAQTKALVYKWSNGEEHFIDFGEDVYTALPYANPEFATNCYMYYYTSLTTPNTTFEYNMLTRERRILKQTETVESYNPHEYETKRLWATANDSIKIPISILHKKGLKLNGSNPMLIYAYGAFGHSENPTFQPSIFSLIDRGFVYAIAHVRGGEEMGKKWHSKGCLLNKKNTFTDFISCTQFLIDQNYSSPSRIIAQGEGAGGLLMGAVANMRPDLYKGIIAESPHIDLLTSPQLHEIDEWGNPNDPCYYCYLKEYSPYDQIKQHEYPNMLVTSSCNTSQQSFEPVRWVAKLRANKTDNNLLLLKADLELKNSKHPFKYKPIENRAFVYAFMLQILNIKP